MRLRVSACVVGVRVHDRQCALLVRTDQRTADGVWL